MKPSTNINCGRFVTDDISIAVSQSWSLSKIVQRMRQDRGTALSLQTA